MSLDRLGKSFLPPCSGFPLTLANSIAVALNDSDIAMMQQAIGQRDDTRRVGEDFVPFFGSSGECVGNRRGSVGVIE
jgi:hypothetical protein